MARRIFLHVASTKTGTTFLQRVMWSHRDRLLEQQILLPGAGRADHLRAAIDVREEPHRLPDPQRATDAWARLVAEMADWDGDAVVSHELFAPATAEQASRAIDSLGLAEVHVVVTARDLARQVPAEWQEHLKHRSVISFPEFVRTLRSDQEHGPYSPNGYYFWHQQDLRGVVRRWGKSLPDGRVHVVTVPRFGTEPEELWKRFAGLIGIDGREFDLAGARMNSSLRAEQAEVLRRLNLRLGDRLPLPGPYPETVKEVLAHRILATRPGTAFGVLGDDLEFAVQWARGLVAGLLELEVDVVGDLEELVPTNPDTPVSGDASVTADAVLDEALEALVQVLGRFAAERSRRHRLRSELDEARLRIRVLQGGADRAGRRPGSRLLDVAQRLLR